MWKRISSFLLPCYFETKYHRPRQTAAGIEDALLFAEIGLVSEDWDHG
ncbi:predicted protein [Sclerotinia sclerotiorum 1980 UF-70]|uniref:Uncharacterized protein n=1 Tax=Sclerotinia sclerotiorum (strain ATCC 18683 / 1980 / Ss-1) TaxID=665079 RepID=A7F4B4_SCLS1|nr:predicted protein [Sclerotinia sclerotiorum 1980 UF-70]EDN97585.1 predicted protein [Sclerotinia sclerotiorum 1980 UF-70]